MDVRAICDSKHCKQRHPHLRATHSCAEITVFTLRTRLADCREYVEVVVEENAKLKAKLAKAMKVVDGSKGHVDSEFDDTDKYWEALAELEK